MAGKAPDRLPTARGAGGLSKPQSPWFQEGEGGVPLDQLSQVKGQLWSQAHSALGGGAGSGRERSESPSGLRESRTFLSPWLASCPTSSGGRSVSALGGCIPQLWQRPACRRRMAQVLGAQPELKRFWLWQGGDLCGRKGVGAPGPGSSLFLACQRS